MSKPFNVTYNLRTVGEPVGLVNGTIMVIASDACAALLKATEILVDDEDIYEADWAAMNVDVQPAEVEVTNE